MRLVNFIDIDRQQGLFTDKRHSGHYGDFIVSPKQAFCDIHNQVKSRNLADVVRISFSEESSP